MFARGVSLEQERWSAHVDWASQLFDRHTLITFNYDRVLERIAEHVRKQSNRASRPRVCAYRPERSACHRDSWPYEVGGDNGTGAALGGRPKRDRGCERRSFRRVSIPPDGRNCAAPASSRDRKSSPEALPLSAARCSRAEQPRGSRLAELLKFAAERGGNRTILPSYWQGSPIPDYHFQLGVHQLYSQDFFTVYDERMLLMRDSWPATRRPASP